MKQLGMLIACIAADGPGTPLNTQSFSFNFFDLTTLRNLRSEKLFYPGKYRKQFHFVSPQQREIQTMATETSTSSNKDAPISNVQPISSMTGTVEYSKNMAAKSLSTVANSYKFMWHAWLGTAVTSQEAATSFAQDMAKKGEKTEQQAIASLNSRMKEARSATARLREKTRTRIDTVEARVGANMGRSLHFMGVPTRGDVDKLALLMADMSDSIDELTAMKQQSKAKRPSSSS